jgi:hypothetical protein
MVVSFPWKLRKHGKPPVEQFKNPSTVYLDQLHKNEPDNCSEMLENDISR